MVKIKVIPNEVRNIELLITTTNPNPASLIESFLSKTKPIKPTKNFDMICISW